MTRHALPLAVALLHAAVSNTSAQELRELATCTGHTFTINRAALSPDGKILASGGGDTRGGELKLWETASGKELASLTPYTDTLYSLAFSPDGRLLASGSNRVQIWDVAARKESGTFKNLGDWTNVLSFSADGKKLAAATSRTARLWDIGTAKELASFQSREYHYGRMAFSRDLATLAVSNYQDIDLWDAASGKERAILSEHRGEVSWLGYSTDGRTLVASSTYFKGPSYKWIGDVKLWDVATGKERMSFTAPFGRIQDAALSPDGTTLALLDSPELRVAADLKIVDVVSARQVVIRNPPRYSFTSLAFTSDGTLAVIGTSIDQKTVKLWHVTSGTKERQKK